jgi:hypothetical protein
MDERGLIRQLSKRQLGEQDGVPAGSRSGGGRRSQVELRSHILSSSPAFSIFNIMPISKTDGFFFQATVHMWLEVKFSFVPARHKLLGRNFLWMFKFKTSPKVSDDNWAYQNPLPSLNLSSRRSNLSRSLSPEHASESAGLRLSGPLLVPSRIGYTFCVIYN